MQARTLETALMTAIREKRANALTLLALGGAIVMDDPRRAESPIERAARLARTSLKAWGAR